MPYDYRIDVEHNLLVITGSGTVSSADIKRVVLAFQEDPAWHPEMNMLVDWREVTELLVELEDVRRLAAKAVDEDHLKLGRPLGPRAAVLIRNPEHETIPKIYAAYLRKSGLETKVTYRLREAAEWVGIEAANIPRPLNNQ